LGRPPGPPLLPYATLFRSTASPPRKFTIFASTRQSPQETVAVTARLSTLRSERALPSLRQAPARAFQFDPRSVGEVRLKLSLNSARKGSGLNSSDVEASDV